MQESELKRTGQKSRRKPPRDPNMKAGGRGGDEEARRKPEPEPEVPILQRYTE